MMGSIIREAKLTAITVFLVGMALISSAQMDASPLNDKTESLRADIHTNQLYHFGLIDAFLGGLYEGGYTYGLLKRHGDFGLGAPHMLDGEITILEGKVYQTRSDGKTFEPEDDKTTSYAFVTAFVTDYAHEVHSIQSKVNLERQLIDLIPNDNAMYAIRISGVFNCLKTRAFPPVRLKPYPELTSILDKQEFFDFSTIEGTLVGFYLPVYLKGINIPGFHFHFVSSDKKNGGHVLEVSIKDAKVEIDRLTNFEVQLPESTEFGEFNFRYNRLDQIQKVESGQK